MREERSREQNKEINQGEGKKGNPRIQSDNEIDRMDVLQLRKRI